MYDNDTVQVAVVGAGFAGLTTARILKKAGLSVAVLEARDRLGGRIHTRHAPDGTPIDVGGQWIGPTQDRVLALAHQLGVETFAAYDAGETTYWLDGQKTRCAGMLPPYSGETLAEVEGIFQKLDALAATVNPEFPWLSPDAHALDSISFENWIERTSQVPAARFWMRFLARSVLASDARELSFLHVLCYIRAGGDLRTLISMGGGAQEQRFVKGAQHLAERLADDIRPFIRLGSPVSAIEQDDDGVTIRHATGSLRADWVVVTLPPALAGRLRYSPALPGPRDYLTQRMPMGACIKIQLFYDTPFWRDAGLSGMAVCDRGPASLTYDNSPASGTPGVMVCFIEGDEAKLWTAKTEQERRAALTEELVGLFGPEAAEIRHYAELSWLEEEYSRGGYGGFMVPGAWTSVGHSLRQPVGRIHWAGTETAWQWTGYMDGAIRSGERVAEEILAEIGVGHGQG